MATTFVSTAPRIEFVASVPSRFPFAASVSRLATALHRAIERATVAGAVRAFESGDGDELARYLARGRAMHERFSMPTASQMAVAMEGFSIQPSTGPRASWLSHDDFDDDAILVYVHGGSFIADRSPRLTAMIARVAKAARLKTLMVDYRLAPEHPCPAAVDDVCTALNEIIASGCDADRIGIVAESAGAAIALAACVRMRDGGVKLGAICLLSPWTDLALTGRSAAARSVTGESPISMESMAICAHFYLQGLSPLDPVASPVYGDLRSLPAMLIQTSRTDALHDDARILAERVHDAGSDVTLRVWSRGSHVFERLFDKQSERAIGDAGAFLRRHLNRAQGLRAG